MYFRKTLEDLVQKLSNYLYPKKVTAKDDITVQRYFKVRSTNINLGEAFRVNKIYGTLKPKSWSSMPGNSMLKYISTRGFTRQKAVVSPKEYFKSGRFYEI